MKEKWAVYIRGVEGRGNEVIETLVNLGGKNNLVGVLGNNSSCIYFINHDGYIKFTDVCSETGKIIEDYYKEINLPEKWKDGDILIDNDETNYKIFQEYDSDSDTQFYAHNVSMHINGTLTQYNSNIWHGEKILCFQKDYRLATPLEIKRFHEFLNKCGKEWDAKKKQLVNFNWKPKEGEPYWLINSNGTVDTYCWCGDDMDNSRFNFGNCFKTKKEAKIAAKKIKHLLKEE